ncbi:MAG TPA: hypothetical protein VGJ26_17665 [Pirellulales bacterium]|jgi:hypothetical protein
MATPHRLRWLRFSLRTLFVATLFVAFSLLIFRQQKEIRELSGVITAHGLTESSAELLPNEFRVSVRKLSGSIPPAVYEVVIETAGEAYITVASFDRTTSVRRYPSAARELTRSNVLIVADEISGPGDMQQRCRYLVQIGGPNDSFAGGPGTYLLPCGKTLAELFEVVLKPGVYPRDTPLPMSVLDGNVTTLDVH